MRHLLLAISFISLAIAVVAFIDNRTLRDDIHKVLGTGGKTPEEELPWGYKQEQLQKFADMLRNSPAGPNATWLDRYRHPALLWNDVVFAIALGIFSATFLVWVLLQFEPAGALRYLPMVMAVSALLYAVFDTAEDLALERILRTPDAISDNATRIASALTQLKALSLSCSGAGLIAWVVLQHAVPERARPILPKITGLLPS